MTVKADPSKWDLIVVINIVMLFLEYPLFKDQFIINEGDHNASELKNTLKSIKALRNKFSHSENISAREMYEGIDNTQRLFESFKPDKPHKISI